MDRKTFIQALLWATVAFLVWNLLATKFLSPPQSPTTQPAQTIGGASSDSHSYSSTSQDSSTSQTASGPSSDASAAFKASGSAEETVVHLGNGAPGKENPYRLDLKLSNKGASIQEARLSDHAESLDISTNGPSLGYPLLAPIANPSGFGDLYSYAVEGINIDRSGKGAIGLSDLNWTIVKQQETDKDDSATFQADISDSNGDPVLSLRKTYRLPKQPWTDNRKEQRHDLFIDWEFENHTDIPIQISLTERGPLGMKSEYARMEDRHLFAATPGETPDQAVVLESEMFGKVDPEKTLYRQSNDSSYDWSGISNKYFTAITVPLTDSGKPNPNWIQEIKAIDVDRNKSTVEDCTLLIVSKFKIPEKNTIKWGQHVYLGPADKITFTSPSNSDYAGYGFQQIVDLGYSFCTFSWLADIMVWLLDTLESVIPNYGVAIIILVLVVRAILHPMTKKGQINMVRMQERMGSLQPKLEKLKEQYGNDKARMQQEQMKLYSEEGINPATSMLSSCLPMGIQMPIWVALYTSLSNNVAMRHHGFCLWINDLTAPDALISFSHPYNVPILSWLAGPVNSLNLLPILLAITMFAQQKMMPKPQNTPASGAQADQAAAMQKMMPMMSVMFAIFFYNMPSGLNLYIMASTLFGTIEQIYVRKHIKELKEKGTIVKPKTSDSKPRKKGWMMKRLEELQKQAEVQQQIKNKGRNKKK